MALADSNRAIGAVTQLVADHLNRRTSQTISSMRPEQAASSGGTNPKLNVFLYETQIDATLRNASLDEGRPPPLWLVLKYLLTAYDSGGDSNSAAAHELLGQGMGALQELAFLLLDNLVPANVIQALEKNPETLKITFDDTTAELVSTFSQGADDVYRLAVGFQVRPVLIAPTEPASYSLLVGVDYTAVPQQIIGEEGVQLAVLPSLGPSIDSVSPAGFEVNDTLEIRGNDLHVSGLEVLLGAGVLAVTSQSPDRLTALVNGTIAGGGVVSAGHLPVSVRQTLPSGRFRTSNLLVGNLRPVLTSAAPNTLALNGDGNVTGNLVLNGVLLGTATDDVFVAFHRDGTVVRSFDAVIAVANQTQLTVSITAGVEALPPGPYRIILRVNGQQARTSPEINWTP